MYYAGIGSRKTPEDIQKLMTNIASRLEKLNFILRSGGAEGADKAFEDGVKSPVNKIIFRPEDAESYLWAFETAENYLPLDRYNFSTWSPYIQGLIARNMMQILGADGKTPVEFIVCWTPTLDYSTSKSGGTGYALRLAEDCNISIFNLLEKDHQDKLEKLLKDLENEI